MWLYHQIVVIYLSTLKWGYAGEIFVSSQPLGPTSKYTHGHVQYLYLLLHLTGELTAKSKGWTLMYLVLIDVSLVFCNFVLILAKLGQKTKPFEAKLSLKLVSLDNRTLNRYRYSHHTKKPIYNIYINEKTT